MHFKIYYSPGAHNWQSKMRNFIRYHATILYIKALVTQSLEFVITIVGEIDYNQSLFLFAVHQA